MSGVARDVDITGTVFSILYNKQKSEFKIILKNPIGYYRVVWNGLYEIPGMSLGDEINVKGSVTTSNSGSTILNPEYTLL